LRIDSQISYSERYPLAHLKSILARNRFEGGVLFGDLTPALPAFVKGVVVRGDQFDNAKLDRLQQDPKFRGVACSLAGAEVPDFLAELERRSIPLDLSANLSLAPRIARLFPNLRVAFDPAIAPLSGDDWEEHLDCAAEYSNVFCKLNGLAPAAPICSRFVRHALRVWGPRRLMFGSKWPMLLPEYSWKATLAAFTQAIGAQPIEIREELLGGTAARFYAL
jgi:L-fucono-1,5-lactonase